VTAAEFDALYQAAQDRRDIDAIDAFDELVYDLVLDTADSKTGDDMLTEFDQMVLISELAGRAALMCEHPADAFERLMISGLDPDRIRTALTPREDP
jgi:hypothetical protein